MPVFLIETGQNNLHMSDAIAFDERQTTDFFFGGGGGEGVTLY